MLQMCVLARNTQDFHSFTSIALPQIITCYKCVLARNTQDFHSFISIALPGCQVTGQVKRTGK